MAEIKIPDKLTFKKKEVVNITKLDAKVLDFWEEEFKVFHPVVNKMGETFYPRKDVETILRIKQWMVIERKGREEVKSLLAAELELDGQPAAPSKKGRVSTKKIDDIKSGLHEILTILDKNGNK